MAIPTSTPLKVVQELILLGDVVSLNVFYYWTIFTEDQTDAAVLAAIRGHVETMYATLDGQIQLGVEFGSMKLYRRNGVHWDQVGSRSPDDTFNNSGDMAPHGVSALVRAYTVEPRVIGRKYIGGFCESEMTAGVLTGTALTALALFNDEWVTVIEIDETNELWPGVWSTVLGTVALMSGTTVTPVHPGYQRRRRPGVGI